MILDILVIVGIASFLGLVVLGHIILAGDLWRFWMPEKKPHDQNEALGMPAE